MIATTPTRGTPYTNVSRRWKKYADAAIAYAQAVDDYAMSETDAPELLASVMHTRVRFRNERAEWEETQ